MVVMAVMVGLSSWRGMALLIRLLISVISRVIALKQVRVDVVEIVPEQKVKISF